MLTLQYISILTSHTFPGFNSYKWLKDPMLNAVKDIFKINIFKIPDYPSGHVHV
jgi:hypothetical protein